MARPRVFISSTFYNLKEVRASLEAFVRQMGYDPVVTENITYLPGQALDESCYLEAGSCDVFVLIVGGRYGSAVSKAGKDQRERAKGESESEAEKQPDQELRDFYDQYKSITHKEFDSARARDVPIYVAVDRAVNVEYETWKLNRHNKSVRYRQVDHSGVFELIEFIRQETNSPVHEFEHSADILGWLREQWAGLFQKMLAERSEQARLASLELHVEQLGNVSETLRSYLETLLGASAGVLADKVISKEKRRRVKALLQGLPWIRQAVEHGDTTYETVGVLVGEAKSFEHLARLFEAELGDLLGPPGSWIDSVRGRREVQWVLNRVREEVGEEVLGFESTGDGRVAPESGA